MTEPTSNIATDKQISYLKNLGYTGSFNITKSEASTIISSFLPPKEGSLASKVKLHKSKYRNFDDVEFMEWYRSRPNWWKNKTEGWSIAEMNKKRQKDKSWDKFVQLKESEK